MKRVCSESKPRGSEGRVALRHNCLCPPYGLFLPEHQLDFRPKRPLLCSSVRRRGGREQRIGSMIDAHGDVKEHKLRQIQLFGRDFTQRQTVPQQTAPVPGRKHGDNRRRVEGCRRRALPLPASVFSRNHL